MTRLVGAAPALLGWCCGLCLAFYPLFLSGFALVPGETGDTRLIHYLLEHGYRWLLREPPHRDLWSPPIFYPHPNTAAYSDLLLSAGPFYWCWRLLGISPETSYQLWMLTVASLNYWLAYLFLARCLRLSGASSALGAFLFAFASSRLGHITHMQLFVHFYTILCLYALYRLLESSPREVAGPAPVWAFWPLSYFVRDGGARGWIAVFFLGVVCQFYASFYLGWFLGLGLAITGLWALCVPACRRRLGEVLRAYPLSLAFWAVVAAVPMADVARHYLMAHGEIGDEWEHGPGTIARFTPTFASWLVRGEGNWFNLLNALHAWGVLKPGPWPEPEQAIGVGPITTLAVVLGLWSQRRLLVVRLLLATSLTFVVVMTVLWPPQVGWTVLEKVGWVQGDPPAWLGKDVAIWWWLYPWVPAGGAMRAVCRVGLLLLVPASVGLAYFAERKGRLAVVVAVLCVLEQGRDVPAFAVQEHRDGVARVVRLIPPGCKAFFYHDPDSRPVYRAQLDAMWAALQTGVPTVNGYSGSAPPAWKPLRSDADDTNEGRIRRHLRAWLETHHVKGEDVAFIEPQPP
jgi:hypothetical protein